MIRTMAFLSAIIFCTVGSVFAESMGGPGGDWPKAWPKELEPLRKQAWTWEGGRRLMKSYHIPFSDQKEFKSLWPHLLKLKSEAAPLTLLSGPRVQAWTTRPPKGKTAGVIIRLPLNGKTEGPYSLTYIDLVVDGKIVDLNRNRLPKETTIIDKRFDKKLKKAAVETKTSTEKKSAKHEDG